MEQIDWQINKSTLECNQYILQHEVNCDVSFKVGEDGEIIKAHKLILSTRSPVFDRMFNGSFFKSEEDPVIPDVSPAAFRTLLRYCYYECLDIEGNLALSVLYAATKYMLPILDRAARKTLIQKLDSSIIWDVCKYSTEIGDEELLVGCITYLKGNLSSSNILDVIKYAVTTGDKDLHDYIKQHSNDNLSQSNILDFIKYAVSIGDKELQVCCKKNLNKHLSGSNLWEVYKYALNEGDIEVHQHCKEYFKRDLVTVRAALQSEEFLNIPIQLLSDILHINDTIDKANWFEYKGANTMGISISEIELFKACNAWAGAECLRQEIDPTGANKRKVLGECLYLIQFPTVLQKDLLTVVYTTGILTQAEIVHLARYLHKVPGSECQVDFPSKERHFMVTPSGSTAGSKFSTVYIESEVRVMLSRVWTKDGGSYKVTVSDEGSQRSWSVVLDTKHENHVWGDGDRTLHYMDIEPPQVLDAGTRYSVAAQYITSGTNMGNVDAEHIRIPERLDPYTEVKITQKPNTVKRIYSLTLSFV